MGVRVALGATAGRIMALVVGQAARLAAIGVAIGLGGALIVSRLMRTLLFEVRPSDPLTLAAVVAPAGTVIGMAAVGAARIEAAVALRAE